MTKLSDLSLYLPLSSLRAALTALSRSATDEYRPRAKLLSVSITINSVECEAEVGQCIGRDHGRQRALEVGNLIANLLEARGCTEDPLSSLSLEDCQINKRI